MAAHRFRMRGSYRREGPRREPFEAVLIVCEGQKTEPQYFEGLKAAHRLGNNVEITPLGRDPLSIVNYAIEQLQHDSSFARAYCVFDRDGHATFSDAVNKARDCALGKSGKLRLARSVPCFEVWPLLHFEYSTAEIVGGRGKTPGERALADLQKVMPDYCKNDRGIFEKLSPKLEVAMTNAIRLATHNQKTDSDNPSTEVHTLVEYLMQLKR